MSEVTEVKRPTWNEDLIKELAQVVGKTVNEWCNNETPLSDCIESAEKILQYHRNDNGYELARQFEDQGFSPDSELVELLDNVWYESDKILQSAIYKWVQENSLELGLEVGQKVIASFVRKGQKECEIVKLYPNSLQYGVWYEGMGHEKEKGHTIVNKESIVGLL